MQLVCCSKGVAGKWLKLKLQCLKARRNDGFLMNVVMALYGFGVLRSNRSEGCPNWKVLF